MSHASPLLAVRIGEASLPGPAQTPPHFRAAIINPTAIRKKEQEICSLACQLVCVAETSAVAKVQAQFSAVMRQLSYKIAWGAPVLPLLAHDGQSHSLRGMAGGVAALANIPLRFPLQPVEPAVYDTTRLMECFVKVGRMEIRVICVYGLPQCHANALDTNNFLMQAVLSRICLSKVPTLVAGDWNCDPTALPVWPQLQALGFVEAFAAVKALLNIDLPPTCKGATSYDTFFISQPLLSCLQGAMVMSDSCLFHAHSPLILDFSMPCQLPCTHRWKLPKTWDDFSFSRPHFVAMYESSSADFDACIDQIDSRTAVQSSFAQWASTVESAVDAAIRHHAQGNHAVATSGLPGSHRGRCRPVQRVRRAIPQLPRQGREGDFMVSHETTDIRVKWRVRQCRRARTMLGGLRKFLSLAEPDAVLLQQLLNEWAAITRAKGYGTSFAELGPVVGFCSTFPY